MKKHFEDIDTSILEDLARTGERFAALEQTRKEREHARENYADAFTPSFGRGKAGF